MHNSTKVIMSIVCIVLQHAEYDADSKITYQLPVTLNTAVTVRCVEQALGDQMLRITRPTDKKQVLFYNTKELRIPVGEG